MSLRQPFDQPVWRRPDGKCPTSCLSEGLLIFDRFNASFIALLWFTVLVCLSLHLKFPASKSLFQALLLDASQVEHWVAWGPVPVALSLGVLFCRWREATELGSGLITLCVEGHLMVMEEEIRGSRGNLESIRRWQQLRGAYTRAESMKVKRCLGEPRGISLINIVKVKYFFP